MGDDGTGTIETIRESIRSFRTAQIYITFAELGIGSALASGPLLVEDLARATDTDPLALARFIDAAEAFGLVQHDAEDLIALTPLGVGLYDPSSQHSLIHALRLEGAFYERWGRLAEAVRIGGRPEANRAQEDDPDWVRIFTLALYENSRNAAQAAANAVSEAIPLAEASSRRRVVDLGGGHGGYSIALSRIRSDLDVTVFDLPPVIAVTSEIVEQTVGGERVTSIAGDFHHDDFGHGLDAVMLFGVLHGETPDNAIELLRKIHDALNSGGRLLIRSQGQTTAAQNSGDRELFDLHMLLSTSGGRVQRSMDVKELIASCGFSELSPIDIESPGSGQILVFRS